MLEVIKDNNQIYAILVRANFKADGAHFFTPDHFSQQIGYLHRPQGYVVKPHMHNLVIREISFTQEVLFVRSGKIKISIYTEKHEHFQDITLQQHDFILLAHGGHSIEMLEETELIEVKQGPYISPEIDKIIFNPLSISVGNQANETTSNLNHPSNL
ncbi:MAG: hypothetical protein HQK52_02335 [Oligoflexia bacterium]|nr:hypothetical protein [Oligoflexia bacterium]